jgi:hypothetical protein
MEFVLESNDITDYLKSDTYVDFFSESIQRKADGVPRMRGQAINA